MPFRQTEDSHEMPLEEEFSVEAPSPPEFLPYEAGAPPVSYNDNLDEQNDGTDVRHGRGGRFWLLVVGALVLVVGAVGGGVGAAMASGGTESSVQGQMVQSGDDNNGGSAAAGSASGSNSYADEDRQGVEGDFSVQLSSTSAPTSEVFDIILTHSRYHGLEFEDPNSYQSKAAMWVESTADLTTQSIGRLIQRYALACLYYATNGVENFYTKDVFGEGNVRPWIDETGWLTYADECTWYKITCNLEGEVTKIELDSNRLAGSLPPELALLKSIETLDLYQNMFHNQGDAGNHWLGEMTSLKELFYARTYMEYAGIPTVIGLLTNLQEYDCSYTLYHGPLVGQTWSTLSNLEYLHIGGNQFNSSIPLELARMPKLEFLYAEYTDLQGDLSFVPMMPSIVELWVDRNPMLAGTIPTEVGLVSTLRSFSVTGCDLVGTLPTELGSLRLTQFWCYNNSLAGEIPSEFGQIDELVRLGIEENRFYGSVPAEICALRTPNGLLDKLEVDCDGEVECACCTCCGASCFGGEAGRRLLDAPDYSSIGGL